MRKVIYSFVATLLLFGYSTICKAQEDSLDKMLSLQYEQDIKVVESEIKTLKLKLESDKGNQALKSELIAKKERRSELKKEKSILEKAIKNQEEADKIVKKAEKAMAKAEKAAKEAQKIKEELLVKAKRV